LFTAKDGVRAATIKEAIKPCNLPETNQLLVQMPSEEEIKKHVSLFMLIRLLARMGFLRASSNPTGKLWDQKL